MNERIKEYAKLESIDGLKAALKTQEFILSNMILTKVDKVNIDDVKKRIKLIKDTIRYKEAN